MIYIWYHKLLAGLATPGLATLRLADQSCRSSDLSACSEPITLQNGIEQQGDREFLQAIILYSGYPEFFSSVKLVCQNSS